MLHCTARAALVPAIYLVAIVGAASAPVAGQVIEETFKLTANDAAAGDLFGQAVAISDGIVAVGAWFSDDNAEDSGSAYLFDAATGEQLYKLLPSESSLRQWFGRSIDVADGRVAVGAPQAVENGIRSGAVYIFDTTTGEQLAKLTPDDGAVGDSFGWSVAIDRAEVAIGATGDDENGNASGSVYIFNLNTGNQIHKLVPPDGGELFEFGASVDLNASSGIVAIGMPGDNNENGTNSGSAYLYNSVTGELRAKLLPADGAADDYFGRAIAFDRNYVTVGSAFDDDNGSVSGSAYVFRLSDGTQLTKLLPDDGAEGDRFGQSVAIEDGMIVVGATTDDNGDGSGSAYLFDAFTGGQLAKLLPSDGATLDSFGGSLSIDGGRVVAGAVGDDDHGSASGSAYIFDTVDCPVDLNGDGVVNTQDFIVFLNAWTSGEEVADWNDDGSVNTQDFIAYLNDWVTGC